MRKHGESGFVMIIVLGVLVLMTVLTLGFARRALLERRAATLSMEHTIALSYARGAAQRGIATLRNRAKMEGLGTRDEQGGPPTWREHAKPTQEKLFDAKEVGDKDKVDYIIEDLDGHISMNLAPEEMFEKIKGLGVSVVNKIIDRRGGDGTDRPKTPFLVTEEVLTLGKIDDEEWYGKSGKPGMRDLLSAWGDNRINLNTASAEVLAAVPILSKGTAQSIISYRIGDDGKLNTKDDRYFASFADLANKCEIPTSEAGTLMRYCKLNSRFFTITGLATRMQGKVRAFCEATVEVRGDIATVLQWREGPVGS